MSVNRTLASTRSGVMLSAGVPASDAPVSGSVPSTMVPRRNAAEPDSVTTPYRTAMGASPDASTPAMRTSA